MKKYDYISGQTRINGKPLKVKEVEPYKTPYDEDIEKQEEHNKKLKTIALSVLLAGVIALNIFGVHKYLNSNNPTATDKYGISYEYNLNDYVEPEVRTRYVAPSGYTLTWIDGTPYAVKDTVTYVDVITYTDENGKTIYTAPSGYTLEYRDGVPIAVKKERTMVSPAVVQEYCAPEGYVLIGNKCYKIIQTEENTKGR